MINQKYKILLKLLFLFIPIIVILVPVVYVLNISGEFDDPDGLVMLQSSTQKHILYGKAYSLDDRYYKFKCLLSKKPELISLGTSRSMMFRQEFFNDDINFYNSGMIGKIDEYNLFINELHKYFSPKVIIAEFDQNFFSERWNKSYTSGVLQGKFTEKTSKTDILLTFWKKILEDSYSKYFTFDSLSSAYSDNRIGIDAKQYNLGYRSDGSRSYSLSIPVHLNPNHPDNGFKKTIREIELNGNRFTADSSISINSIKELRMFLDFCKNNNIYVIGFLPPFPPTIYNKMKEQFVNKLAYMPKLYPVLISIFDSYGYEFYDYSNSEVFGGKDTEIIDGIHCSEKSYLKLFIDMSKKSKVLGQYCKIEKLQTALENSKNDISVFEEKF